MGFFKNLFEKKICDVCGEEIGLLGNRKLKDGNCCKTCAQKLSPWFTERKESTVEEIKQQVADREENRKAVSAFHTTRSFGEDVKVLVDEDTCKFMVTRAKDFQKENPDVLDFAQVTACDLDVQESRCEVYKHVKDKDGTAHNVSYTPPRYQYSYDFKMTIRVNHPYIDEMEFSLSDGRIPMEEKNQTSAVIGSSGNTKGSATPPTPEECRANPQYERCERWAYDLEQILLHGQGKTSEKIKSLIEKYEEFEKKCANALQKGDELGFSYAQRYKIQAIQAMKDAYRENPRPELADRIAQITERFQNESRPVVEKTTATKYCPECGAALIGGKFCPECGARIVE